MPDEELILEIARQLRIAGNGITRVKDRNSASIGLTSGQAEALRFIAGHPDCRISDLRAHLGASHQAACGIVDRLEAKGMVSTGVDASDGRARTLRATADGREALERHIGMGVEANLRAFCGLTDEDLARLSVMLGTINANLDRDRRRPLRFNGRIA